MVSGFRISPKLLSKIESGDARPIVILVKFDFILISFLNDINQSGFSWFRNDERNKTGTPQAD